MQMRASRRRLVMTFLVCGSLLLFMAMCLFWALGRQEVNSEPSGTRSVSAPAPRYA